jgi:hypothetical protein
VQRRLSELTYLILLDFEIYCVITFGSCLLLRLLRGRIGKGERECNWKAGENYITVPS